MTYDLVMFYEIHQNTPPNEKCLTMTNTGLSLLESNLEEETSKSRKRKPSYFVCTSHCCSGRAFICICCEIMPLFIFSSLESICQLCNCGQASGLLRLVRLLSRTLSEQRSSDLCFPAERIHFFGGSYLIDNAKTYSTNTQ